MMSLTVSIGIFLFLSAQALIVTKSFLWRLLQNSIFKRNSRFCPRDSIFLNCLSLVGYVNLQKLGLESKSSNFPSKAIFARTSMKFLFSSCLGQALS